MNATDLVRRFRAEVPGPDDAARARARGALHRAIEAERSRLTASGLAAPAAAPADRGPSEPGPGDSAVLDVRTRPAGRPTGRRRRPSWTYRPIVAVAGAVVVIIVAAGVFIPFGHSKGSDTQALTTLPTGGPAPPPTAAAANPAAAGRWLAVIEMGASAPAKTLTVRNAVTGAVTARVTTPVGLEGWFSLSGSAVPGLFFVSGSTPTTARQKARAVIYRLQVDGRGRLSSFTPLRIDGALPEIVWDLAASPDGTRVAFAVADSSGSQPGVWGPARIDLAEVATGRRTTFASTSTGDTVNLSWDATGRYLAFGEGGTGPPVLHDGLWILDTTRSGDLFAISRRVPTGRLSVGEYQAVLSADARHMYLVSLDENITVTGIDLATGQQRQLLRTAAAKQPASPGWDNVITRSPDGSALLVMEAGGVAHRIDLATSAATDIPFTGGQPLATAW